MIRMFDRYRRLEKRCNSEVTVRHVTLGGRIVPERRTVTVSAGANR